MVRTKGPLVVSDGQIDRVALLSRCTERMLERRVDFQTITRDNSWSLTNKVADFGSEKAKRRESD